MHSIKILNSKFKILLRSRNGQSLIEILIALAIGAILIGTAAIGVSFMLKSTSTNEVLQSGSGMLREIVDKVRVFAGADWQNLNSLTRGLGTRYFLNASGTSLFSIQGEEGVLDNDVLSGLVGRWNFDEFSGTNTYDSTGNNNTGILTNGVSRATSTCKVGYCANFDGNDDYVRVTDPASGILDVTDAYSISFWIKSSSTATYAFIISKSSGGAGGGYEMFFSGGGKIRFSSCDFSGSCAGGYFDISTTLSYNDGIWHHVIGTVSTNSLAKIYVDGLLVKESSTVTQNNIANAYDLIIGGRGTGGSDLISGSIDDVRIYNKVLSSSEVTRIYQSGIYSRFFSIEDVCRSNDSSSTITGVSPCALGSFWDPSTEKISAYVQWIAKNDTTGEEKIIDYITRWKNSVFRQTDWSGGSGTEGPITSPNKSYSSSTNVDITSGGSIRIHGL